MKSSHPGTQTPVNTQTVVPKTQAISRDLRQHEGSRPHNPSNLTSVEFDKQQQLQMQLTAISFWHREHPLSK